MLKMAYVILSNLLLGQVLSDGVGDAGHVVSPRYERSSSLISACVYDSLKSMSRIILLCGRGKGQIKFEAARNCNVW